MPDTTTFSWTRHDYRNTQTVAELLHQAEQLKISPLQVVERIVAGKIPDIKPPVKKKLAHFAGVIRDMRKFAIEVCVIPRYCTADELLDDGTHTCRTGCRACHLQS